MLNNTSKFVRYHELNRNALNVEYHIHTNQTDGNASIENVLRNAHGKCLSAVAFTEHVRKETDWFKDFAETVKKKGKDYPGIKVYVGCEAKVLDKTGRLDISEEILNLSDIVLGSVHRFPDNGGGYIDFNTLDAKSFAEIECELALALLEKAPINVLAHPGGMYQRKHGTYPENLLRKLFKASLKRGIAMEINSSYYLADFGMFLDLCQEFNPYVSIGSDAHTLDEIGYCRDLLYKRERFR